MKHIIRAALTASILMLAAAPVSAQVGVGVQVGPVGVGVGIHHHHRVCHWDRFGHRHCFWR